MERLLAVLIPRYSMLFRVILHTLEGGTRLVHLPEATKGKVANASCPLFETHIWPQKHKGFTKTTYLCGGGVCKQKTRLGSQGLR